MKELPGWELMLLRTKALAGRPSVPAALRGRVRVRTARSGQARASILNEAPIFVPALAGLRRVRLEASAAGAAIASPPGVHEQPALAAAAVARLAESPELRGDVAAEGRRNAESESFAELGRELDELYRSLAGRRRRSKESDPLADRPWITVDLHMHTSWSHDCLVEPEELVEHALAEGLGAIAVTDHNAFGGAEATVEAARGTDLLVIPGEEVKTDNQGEVIGLFLEREIPGACPSRTRLPRSRSRAASSTSPTPSTGCTRSRTRRRSTATCPTSTCSRSTTPGSCSSSTTTRRCGSRASTT